MRRLGLSAATLALVAGMWWGWTRWREGASRYGIPGEGNGLAVEVLNAAGVDGLARAVTRHLRRQGLDVVFFGTAGTDTVRVTRILVRRGDSTRGEPIRAALGAGDIVLARDSSLLLDASVLLGADAAALYVRP